MRNGASTAVCLKLVQSTDGRLGGTFAIWQRCEASRKSSARVPKHIRRLPFERAAPVVGVAQQQSALLDFALFRNCTDFTTLSLVLDCLLCFHYVGIFSRVSYKANRGPCVTFQFTWACLISLFAFWHTSTGLFHLDSTRSHPLIW